MKWVSFAVHYELSELTFNSNNSMIYYSKRKIILSEDTQRYIFDDVFFNIGNY